MDFADFIKNTHHAGPATLVVITYLAGYLLGRHKYPYVGGSAVARQNAGIAVIGYLAIQLVALISAGFGHLAVAEGIRLTGAWFVAGAFIATYAPYSQMSDAALVSSLLGVLTAATEPVKGIIVDAGYALSGLSTTWGIVGVWLGASGLLYCYSKINEPANKQLQLLCERIAKANEPPGRGK